MIENEMFVPQNKVQAKMLMILKPECCMAGGGHISHRGQ